MGSFNSKPSRDGYSRIDSKKHKESKKKSSNKKSSSSKSSSSKVNTHSAPGSYDDRSANIHHKQTKAPKPKYYIRLGIICNARLNAPRNENCCTWHKRFKYRWTSVDEAFLRENPHIARVIENCSADELKVDGYFDLQGVYCYMPNACLDTLQRYIGNTDEAWQMTPNNRTRVGNLRTLMEQLRKDGLKNVGFVKAPPVQPL